MSKAKVILFFMILFGFASFKITKALTITTDTLFCGRDTLYLQQPLIHAPTKFIKDSTQRKKIIVGLFALPFPMGFMGAHRVVLGCKPWIPVVYMATFGGCFGLLPLIDFCVITFSKTITQYENNSQVFMWIKE